MGGSSGAAPKSDPGIAQAALLSAQTGQQALNFSRDQAAISNRWATEDRARYNSVFRPVEDRFVRESTTYDTGARRVSEMNRAGAEVQQGLAASRGAANRNMAAMGVNPSSGRSTEFGRKLALEGGLATVGARNQARTAVMNEGRSRMAQAVNLGQGLAVNPGTSLGMSTNAGNAGFQAAAAGYGQQGNLLNQQYQNQMQSWQANQDSQSGLWGGLGSLAGTALSIFSDEDMKTNKRPARGALRAVERMRVDAWDYKPGQGDGGSHIGTYAQDFARETGRGNGRTINVIDAIGTTMGAIKELSAKVDRMAPRRGAMRVAA